MSWTLEGPPPFGYLVAPGESVGIGFAWLGGADRGVQVVMAQAVPGPTERQLAVTEQSRRTLPDGSTHYIVTVKNESPKGTPAASFRLIGGGVV